MARALAGEAVALVSRLGHAADRRSGPAAAWRVRWRPAARSPCCPARARSRPRSWPRASPPRATRSRAGCRVRRASGSASSAAACAAPLPERHVRVAAPPARHARRPRPHRARAPGGGRARADQAARGGRARHGRRGRGARDRRARRGLHRGRRRAAGRARRTRAGGARGGARAGRERSRRAPRERARGGPHRRAAACALRRRCAGRPCARRLLHCPDAARWSSLTTSRPRSTTSTASRTSATRTRRSPPTSPRGMRAARRRRVPPHGHRRARRQGGAGRGRGRALAEGVGRPDRRGLPRARADRRGDERLLHPHDGSGARGVRAALRGDGCASAATSTRARTRASTARPARRSTREDDLVDGRCPEHGTVPEFTEERNTFFRLSAYADQLLARYAADPPFVLPQTRLNEVRSFVEGGLQDVSITREPSTGACRCRGIPTRRSTSGSTRSSTTPRRSPTRGPART